MDNVRLNLKVERGERKDYEALACFHYRDGTLGPYSNIYKLTAGRIGIVGVIVYIMPMPACELRNVALAGRYDGLDRVTRIKLINSEIRRIARVVIEPRFRGLGLAVRLVRETLGLVGVPIVESMAVMGSVNPFFEKAGMKAFTAALPIRCVHMAEALSMVDIEPVIYVDPSAVHNAIESLEGERRRFIDGCIERFLRSYSRRRDMKHCLERTKFVLSKLGDRPKYYIWLRDSN
jgi:hypothetical protein